MTSEWRWWRLDGGVATPVDGDINNLQEFTQIVYAPTFLAALQKKNVFYAPLSDADRELAEGATL